MAFTHHHGVADVGLVLLVVGMEGVRGPHDLLVPAMPAGDIDPHSDRLVGAVGHHDALARLLPPRSVLARWGRLSSPSAGLRLGPRPLALGPARLCLPAPLG